MSVTIVELPDESADTGQSGIAGPTLESLFEIVNTHTAQIAELQSVAIAQAHVTETIAEEVEEVVQAVDQAVDVAETALDFAVDTAVEAAVTVEEESAEEEPTVVVVEAPAETESDSEPQSKTHPFFRPLKSPFRGN